MKKIIFLATLITVVTLSCKKDNGSDNSNADILKNKITDIIPQNYLDTLKNLGLNVNEGTTPPNVTGIYDIKPIKLLKSNIATDVVGKDFTDAKIKLFNQSSTDFGIQLYGKNFINANDTSIATAISGSGNNFTVYGKVKTVSSNGLNTAVFALIITGSIDGAALKNLKFGIVNIDNSKGGTVFIKEGQGRVCYDTDYTSGSSTVFGITAPSLISVFSTTPNP